MNMTLDKFINQSLFDATSHLLAQLGVRFDRVTAEPIALRDYFEGRVSKQLETAMQVVDKAYYVGQVNELTLHGNKADNTLRQSVEIVDEKYEGLLIFAIDLLPEAHVTRTLLATMTRALNRIARYMPVIVAYRQGKHISLATCERSPYNQTWRDGEKVGKVTMLRDIDCAHPHRGHLEILNGLNLAGCNSFDALYNQWLNTFSNELLTKKFYGELSDWYAWAVQIVKFPNDLATRDDDAKFNHESCIRLITRLIFVWFLKQKHLIPGELFDERYIHDNLIEDFDPHSRKTLHYDAEQSKYYRLILQNLFFAMLNRPIVAEGKSTPNNRRFRTAVTGSRNSDYNVNNLMRYESEFVEGGAQRFLKLANSTVPFLNGGLFDCLDDKPHRIYYDGFSEKRQSLEQLYLPDYLFFGDEVGRGIDLSKWYGDTKKKSVAARGLIDILKRYSFTIEENTPLDQEVSLDPELLGKVFENLLASYNPETQTSARKQTGSFYTPREIVQYMVDESLVAHLKRTCGDENEQLYRDLVSYATDVEDLNHDICKKIMRAIYDCRVLDPACGSGAFPMGVLHQMVHILQQIDPTNEMWKDFMIDRAIRLTEEAYRDKTDADDRKARLIDIEEAFDQNINDPDYARKLYLIEHCIFGVDIQPIATQISKLRFFISLVVDQKPTQNAKENFGIRPLPNLEAKFVTANTLIPLDGKKDLASSADEIRHYEQKLHEINHRIFLAKRNKQKEELRQSMDQTRMMMAQAMENLGFIGSEGYRQMVSWNMFNQNASAPFFDPEWMFGIRDGFDIVIGNPPYIQIKKLDEKDVYKKVRYSTFDKNGDIYCLFYENALRLLKDVGISILITSNKWMRSNYGSKLRLLLYSYTNPLQLIDLGPGVFEAAVVDTNILLYAKAKYTKPTSILVLESNTGAVLKFYECRKKMFKADELWGIEDSSSLRIKIEAFPRLSQFDVELFYGILTGANPTFILSEQKAQELMSWDSKNSEIIKPILRGKDLSRYGAKFAGFYLLCSHNGIKKLGIPPINIERDFPTLLQYFYGFGTRFLNRGEQGDNFYNLRNCAYLDKFDSPKIIYADIVLDRGKFYYDEDGYYTNDTAFIITGKNLLYLLAVLNSKAFAYFYKTFYCGGSLSKNGLRFKRDYLLKVPIPLAKDNLQNTLSKLALIIQEKVKMGSNDADIEDVKVDMIVYRLYNLTYDEVLIIDPETPITREQYESFKVEE